MKIDDSTVQQAGQNILIYEEFKEILSAFKNKGIDIIVLKGAAFAETIYSHIGQRRMADIDLLLRKQDLAEADKELVERILEGSVILKSSTSIFASLNKSRIPSVVAAKCCQNIG